MMPFCNLFMGRLLYYLMPVLFNWINGCTS